MRVVGFPYNAGSPLDRLTSVDELGALAGDRPLALRFQDAFLFQPVIDRTPDLLTFQNAVPFLHGSQPVALSRINPKTESLTWRHGCQCMYLVARRQTDL